MMKLMLTKVLVLMIWIMQLVLMKRKLSRVDQILMKIVNMRMITRMKPTMMRNEDDYGDEIDETDWGEEDYDDDDDDWLFRRPPCKMSTMIFHF